MATISQLTKVTSISNSSLFLVTENGVTKVVTWGFLAANLTGYVGSIGSGFVGSSGITGYVGSFGIGYVGSQGLQGPAGGYTGSSGFYGSQGFRGYTGYSGSKGFGYTGSQGIGYTGSRSIIPGYVGSQGVKGDDGSPGGYVGSQGLKGDPGNPGGYTGSQGLGYTGSGVRGYSGSFGYSGSYGYTGSTGFGYTGSAGGSLFRGYTGSASIVPGYTGSASAGGGIGIGLGSRVTSLTATTSVLADATTANVNITGYKSYVLLRVATSNAAWVRIYTTDNARTSDASRSQGNDPLAGVGVIAEIITTGVSSQLISPAVVGFNDDIPVSTTMYMAVTNNSGSTQAITVTVTALQIEA